MSVVTGVCLTYLTHALRVGVEGEEGSGTVLSASTLVLVVCLFDFRKGVILEVPQHHSVSLAHVEHLLAES